MPRNFNGLRNSLEMYESDKNVVGDLASSLEIFRGFEKVPRVICERIDIRPFLLKKRKMDDSAPDLREPTFVAVHEISKFSKKCTVQVKRENLEKLREEFVRYSKGDRGSDSENIVRFTCDICQKVYLSESKLLNHQETKHVLLIKPENKVRKKVSFSDEIIVHEVNEYHRCRKCSKIYKDYKSLKTHMKEFHKKRKCYICFYCSKDFVDRTFFKVHMKLHCDLCGLLFPNKKSYNEHRRESDTCKIIKKYECKTCHIILFHFLDLKDHSYEHLGDFYICDICKDRFDDKCALSHHIKFLHSKRRPKDLFTTQTDGENTVYACEFCEHTSSERMSIEKHVSTFPEYEKCAMTGYRDFYFCDQCFEKFSTETDMLAHKWTHYLKTAENNTQDAPRPINLLNKEIINRVTNEPVSNKDENTTEVSDVTENNLNVKSQKTLKRYYNINEIPSSFQAKVVVEKIALPNDIVPDNSTTDTNMDLKKPIISEKKRKTLVTKHQCELCLKYLVSKYGVRRHMATVHGIQKEGLIPSKNASQGKLRCADCEEDFALPSLLYNHNCIRIHRPEPPFQDARPEIQLDTPDVYQHNGFDDIITIDDEEDYMDSVDFDIPAPIVELTEFDNALVINNDDPIPNVPAVDGRSDVPVSNNSSNRNSYKVGVNEDQLAVQLPVRQYTNAGRSDRQLNRPLINTTANDTHVNRPLINTIVNATHINRPLINTTVNNTHDNRPLINTTVKDTHVNRPLINTTVNNIHVNRPLILDQLNTSLSSVTSNVTRFRRSSENTMDKNVNLRRLLNTSPVYDARFYRNSKSASVNDNSSNRPLNNIGGNNAQRDRLLNKAQVNDARSIRPSYNTTVNNSRLTRPIINTAVNDARFVRPLNNTTVNDARFVRPLNNDARLNRPLNGLPLNPSLNGERINVQLNVGGKQNQYTLVVQEVPIEF